MNNYYVKCYVQEWNEEIIRSWRGCVRALLMSDVIETMQASFEKVIDLELIYII